MREKSHGKGGCMTAVSDPKGFSGIKVLLLHGKYADNLKTIHLMVVTVLGVCLETAAIDTARNVFPK